MEGLLDSKIRQALAKEYKLKKEELEILIELSHSNKISTPSDKFKKLNKTIAKKAQNYIYIKHRKHGFLFLGIDASFSMKKADLEAMNKTLNKKLKGANQKASNSFLSALSTPPLFKYSQGKLELHKKDENNSIFSLKGTIQGNFTTAKELSQELNSLSYKFKFNDGSILQIHSEEGESTPDPEQISGELPAFATKLIQQLKDQEGVELVCSMTPDGMIGSVYFGQEGRIRLTHAGGPEKEGLGKNEKVTQFNLDMEDAYFDFIHEKPKLANHAKAQEYFQQWISKQLKGKKANNAPSWAKLISKASDAPKDPNELKLFEVFEDLEGGITGWHPSRGTAVNVTVSKKTIENIKKAIEVTEAADKKKRAELKGQKVHDLIYAFWNNRTFYKEIQKLDPEFAKKVRSHTSIAKDINDMIKKMEEQKKKKENA